MTSPGFFGKVTSHGDFVSRRLPPDSVAAWDSWLQQCLYNSKQQLGAAWLENYLTSPIWRFAVAKGVIDAHAWAGVLMPSVDRVGRHFPLLIAAATDAQAPLLQWLEKEQTWYDELENLALSSLDGGFVLEEFDASLSGMSALPGQPDSGEQEAQSTAAWCLPVGTLDTAYTAMPALTANIARHLLHGHSLWWTEGSPRIEASVLVCQGLPAMQSFAAMLDGRWQQFGWRFPSQ